MKRKPLYFAGNLIRKKLSGIIEQIYTFIFVK